MRYNFITLTSGEKIYLPLEHALEERIAFCELLTESYSTEFSITITSSKTSYDPYDKVRIRLSKLAQYIYECAEDSNKLSIYKQNKYKNNEILV